MWSSWCFKPFFDKADKAQRVICVTQEIRATGVKENKKSPKNFFFRSLRNRVHILFPRT